MLGLQRDVTLLTFFPPASMQREWNGICPCLWSLPPNSGQFGVIYHTTCTVPLSSDLDSPAVGNSSSSPFTAWVSNSSC